MESNLRNSEPDEPIVLRPTHLQVDLNIIRQNVEKIRQYVERPMMAVLKANAYGHGLIEMGRFFEACAVDYFAVAYLEEGLALRRAGISLPILVMTGLVAEQIRFYLENDITITVPSVEKLQQVNRVAGEMGVKARVHLIIDTGMERIGIHYYNAESLITASLQADHCWIEGIYSHFANADSADLSHSKQQLERFEQVLEIYTKLGVSKPAIVHMANSGAVLQLPASYFDMVRPGILLYGIYPSDETVRTIEVRSGLRWVSQVVYFKVVEPGHPIGYGSTWESSEATRVVTIPVGYGDGYSRIFSNRAEVMIRGKRYPQVGRVCMDQIMINLGRDGTAYNGDEVILLGRDNMGNGLGIEELAKWADTIPYEIVTNINSRVPRRYVPSIAPSVG